ncbi:MAG: peptidase metallopeptidase [Ramlibacter sp.]|nr:peptidase metallopeptidase [Ramlibacter sp.]
MSQGLDDNPATHDIADDRLTGTSSDDRLGGRSGDDIVDGGSGRDTLEYSGLRGDYAVTRTATGFVVEDHVGLGGRDDLTHIERLQFGDDKLALDVDGNAGTAVKVLGAVFGGEAVHGHRDVVGIALKLLDDGMSHESLMQLALHARLGAGADDHGAVVDLLFANLTGNHPGHETHDILVGMLDRGDMSAAALGNAAAETSINQANINLVGLAQTGVDYV